MYTTFVSMRNFDSDIIRSDVMSRQREQRLKNMKKRQKKGRRTSAYQLAKKERQRRKKPEKRYKRR